MCFDVIKVENSHELSIEFVISPNKSLHQDQKMMLSIDRKKTDKLELAPQLEGYIASHYPRDAVDDHREAITNLQQLREDVRNVQPTNPAGKDLVAK